MNLRSLSTSDKQYYIGLDIGTNSVGWAAVDEDGDLLKFKGKNTWGSRLFDSASTAETTRSHRTLRRRYNRRLQRILDLRAFLYPDVEKVDPDFFNRMGQSSLFADDRQFEEQYVLFNGVDFNEKDYFARYPTIYHLREELVNNPEKADIRLVYLALHHIMKYRGNFLVSGEVSARNVDAEKIVDEFLNELSSLAERYDIALDVESIDIKEIKDIVSFSRETRQERQHKLKKALGFPKEADKLATALSKAVFGYKADFSKIFEVGEETESSFSLGQEDKVEVFEKSALLEDDFGLFRALQGLYRSYLLGGIIKEAPGRTISSSMVALYEKHKEDLARLKDLVKKYLPKEKYRETFKGPKYADGTYKKAGSKGYTAYLLNNHVQNKTPEETFFSYLGSLFKDVEMDPEDREYWDDALKRMSEGEYLRKLRMSDNGAIPHQLHGEELKLIIENQSQYYPSLAENGEKIEALFSFRLPYYVGPLGSQNNPNRAKPFSWAVRKENAPQEPIKPWNFDQIIDRDATAEAFINNLTGTCTYYLGKSVIPKYSLLYSEFCVRQELNVCKAAIDGEKFNRFDVKTANEIFEGVFKRKKKVSIKDVSDFLKTELGMFNVTVTGTQDEKGFASSLTSYNDFRRILGREIETASDYEMVEKLITWVTVFEDKKILRRKVTQTYGPEASGQLTNEQIKAVTKLRYTGWSRLSREFLEDLRVDYEGTYVSIMDLLRDSRNSRRPMNLMEILADDRFHFQNLLDEANKEFLDAAYGTALDSIPGSPALKRGINQSLKIVQEIVQIAGKSPAKICVEMAKEDVGKTKGKRTRTRQRHIEECINANVDQIVKGIKDSEKLKKELRENADRLDETKLYLYFLQGGKCLYSGDPLEIDELENYDIDHIIPRSLVKDNSIDNLALVTSECNRTEKRDVYPLPEAIRRRRLGVWRAMRRVGMLSEKKYERLTCANVSDKRFQHFINRQLVETRQISKQVVALLQSQYPDSKVEGIKAGLTSSLRKTYGFHKSRLVNDFHHAHDAYFACQVSRFISCRFPTMGEGLTYAAFTRYDAIMAKEKHSKVGLVASQFGRDGFDRNTGEITKDTWDAQFELERIRKCLNYKDCFISRKTEVLSGEFWDQTIYSPRVETEKAIPLKNNLDPEKYGYYKSPNSAFYTLIRHTKVSRKKEKTVVELVGIPINVAYRINAKDDLQKYLETRYKNPSVIRARIPKYQLIEWDGHRYYLTSQSEMINAWQLWLPDKYIEELEVVERSYDGGKVLPEDVLREVWTLLTKAVEKNPRYKDKLAAKLKSDSIRRKFEDAGPEEKQKNVLQLLALLHCNAERGLALASTRAGRMDGINFGSNIGSIKFIDTSVTGMFERWTSFEF